MEQYSGQLQELINFKRILCDRYQYMLQVKASYEREFQYWYRIISQENPGNRLAIKASDMMAGLQTGFSNLKKELKYLQQQHKTTKKAIKEIQIHRSNPVS